LGHVRSSRDGSSKIGEAIKKHGLENFEFMILEEVESQEDLDRLERHYITFFETNMSSGGHGYNLTDGGFSGVRGLKMSDETKLLMSEKKKEAYSRSPEIIQRISETVKKLWLNEEYVKKNTVCCPVDSETLLRESDGLSWNDIAAKFEVSSTTVKKWFKAYNLKKEKKKEQRQSWTQEEDEFLLELRKSGYLIREISKLMNRSEASVLKRSQKLLDLNNINRPRYFRKSKL
jgi:group I intron endonuclease